MYSIDVYIDKNNKGFFSLREGGQQVGKIDLCLCGSELILTDTVILSKKYQYTITTRLIHEIVEYAKMHELKIITISKFVQKQFSKSPAKYAEVWEKA